MAGLVEKSSLGILVPEFVSNVLCSVVDSKKEETDTFLVSPFYSVIIVNPFKEPLFEAKRKGDDPSPSLMIPTSITLLTFLISINLGFSVVTCAHISLTC